MGKSCLTKQTVLETMRKLRSGGFPPVLTFFMVWSGLFGFGIPLFEVVNAFAEGAEHPLGVLIGGPGWMLLIGGGIFCLLFLLWRTERRHNHPKDYRMAFAKCVKKEFTDMESSRWYTITVDSFNGAYGQVNVTSWLYDAIQKGEELYALVNGEKEIKAIWRTEDYYLAKDLLPMLSRADQKREEKRRTRQQAEEERLHTTYVFPDLEAYRRGEIPASSRKIILKNWLMRVATFLAAFGAAYYFDTKAGPLMLCYAALVVSGRLWETDQGQDCAFIGRAFRKEKKDEGETDPKLLEQRVRGRMKTRRLLLAAANLLRCLFMLVCCAAGGYLDKKALAGWSLVAAAAFLVLCIRRTIKALKNGTTSEEETFLALLLEEQDAPKET